MQRAELQITRCRGGKGANLGGRERERERKEGFCSFCSLITQTTFVAKRRERRKSAGEVRDENWERAGIKRSRYKAGY